MGPSRKNRPLCNETIRWRSDVPLTEGQLRSKRDEFWDTAPAFDGRKEIWDALRAATNAAEELNFEMAQAILDGANISVPNGYVCIKTVYHNFRNIQSLCLLATILISQ